MGKVCQVHFAGRALCSPLKSRERLLGVSFEGTRQVHGSLQPVRPSVIDTYRGCFYSPWRHDIGGEKKTKPQTRERVVARKEMNCDVLRAVHSHAYSCVSSPLKAMSPDGAVSCSEERMSVERNILELDSRGAH